MIRLILILTLLLKMGVLLSQNNHITIWRYPFSEIYFTYETNQEDFVLDTLINKNIFDDKKQAAYIVYFGKERIIREFTAKEYEKFYKSFNKRYSSYQEFVNTDCYAFQEIDSLESGLWLDVLYDKKKCHIRNQKNIKNYLWNGIYVENYEKSDSVLIKANYKNGFLLEKTKYLKNGNLKYKTTYLDSCSFEKETYTYFDIGIISSYTNTILGYRIYFNDKGDPIQIEEEISKKKDIEERYFIIKEKGIVNDKKYLNH